MASMQKGSCHDVIINPNWNGLHTQRQRERDEHGVWARESERERGVHGLHGAHAAAHVNDRRDHRLRLERKPQEPAQHRQDHGLDQQIPGKGSRSLFCFERLTETEQEKQIVGHRHRRRPQIRHRGERPPQFIETIQIQREQHRCRQANEMNDAAEDRQENVGARHGLHRRQPALELRVRSSWLQSRNRAKTRMDTSSVIMCVTRNPMPMRRRRLPSSHESVDRLCCHHREAPQAFRWDSQQIVVRPTPRITSAAARASLP